MTAATRHARHHALVRAERAAGEAFGCFDDAVGLTRNVNRFTATATGSAVVAALAATLAFAF
jgi:hypothetical protein